MRFSNIFVIAKTIPTNIYNFSIKFVKTNVNDSATLVKRNASNIFDIFSNTVYILKKLTYGTISDIKQVLNARHRAAKNNYILGLEMLKTNHLPDAKVRFLLADFFYNKSPMTKYHIAYIYYLQGDYVKSLKYLKTATNLRPNISGAKELLSKIEHNLNLIAKNKR